MEEQKRLKIRDAAFAADETGQILEAFIDPQSKRKYWHHKYWGINLFQEKEPLDIDILIFVRPLSFN